MRPSLSHSHSPSLPLSLSPFLPLSRLPLSLPLLSCSLSLLSEAAIRLHTNSTSAPWLPVKKVVVVSVRMCRGEKVVMHGRSPIKTAAVPPSSLPHLFGVSGVLVKIVPGLTFVVGASRSNGPTPTRCPASVRHGTILSAASPGHKKSPDA